MDQSHFSISPSGLGVVGEDVSGEEAAAAAAGNAAPQRNQGDVLLIMSSMWIGTFLAAVDGTCVASILGTVGSEFKVSKEIQWLGVSVAERRRPEICPNVRRVPHTTFRPLLSHRLLIS